MTSPISRIESNGVFHLSGEIQESTPSDYRNLAKEGEVSASSVFSSYTPEKAVDGNVSNSSNRWLCDPTDTDAWWQVEFSSEVVIDKLDFYTGNGARDGDTYIIANYTFQYWDNSRWVDFISVTGNDIYHRVHEFIPIQTNKIKLTGLDVGHNRVYEIECYGDYASSIGGGIDFKTDAIHSLEMPSESHSNNNYIDFGNVGSLSSYTLEVWIKPYKIIGTGDNDRYGFSIGATTSGYALWLLHIRGEIKLYAYSSSTSDYILTSGADIQENEWSHIAVTASRNGTAKLYKNGHLIHEENASGSSWGGDFVSGVLRAGRGISYDGAIRDMRLWNRIRSEDEIEQSMNNTVEDTNGLVGHWKMDSIESGSILDYSSNGHNGSPVGDVFEKTEVIGNLFVDEIVESDTVVTSLGSDGTLKVFEFIESVDM